MSWKIPVAILALVLLAGGCFVALTQEEKAELLGGKATLDSAVKRMERVEDDYARLKAEADRLKERLDSGELSISDFAKAKAELDIFLIAVESKWEASKAEVDAASETLSAVQKKIKERSGSGAGAWLQAILGGFGLEIPAGAIAVMEWIRRKRRERQVGLLSRAGGKTREGKDFGEALLEEMTPSDRKGLRAVERGAVNGLL